MAITRRDLLIGMAGVGGASLMAPRVLAGGPFAPHERETLAAAVERILPGAKEAGVPQYMDHWLTKRPFRAVRNYLAHGSGLLDLMAKRETRKNFVACSHEEQDTILARFAAGEVRSGRFDGKMFFQQLMELGLEGFLSDPKYGGNRDRMGWRLVGLPDGLQSCWWNPKGVEMLLKPDEGFHD